MGRNGRKAAVDNDVAHQIMYDLAPGTASVLPYGKLHGKGASVWQRSATLDINVDTGAAKEHGRPAVMGIYSLDLVD